MIVKKELLFEVAEIARAAGDIILTFYKGEYTSHRKEDASPVTEADMAAHEYIVAALAKLTPDIPIVSEEDADFARVTEADFFWLVDPLDGTRSFVRGSGEFTVNIGLVERRYPVLGVLDIPRDRTVYMGAVGLGAFRQRMGAQPESITTRALPEAGYTVLRSSDHSSPRLATYLEKYPVAEQHAVSSAAKFCVVAEGRADLYPRLGPTMEWDTAAGQALIEAAGGRVEDMDGARFVYGKPEFKNGGFVVFGA